MQQLKMHNSIKLLIFILSLIVCSCAIKQSNEDLINKIDLEIINGKIKSPELYTSKYKILLEWDIQNYENIKFCIKRSSILYNFILGNKIEEYTLSTDNLNKNNEVEKLAILFYSKIKKMRKAESINPKIPVILNTKEEYSIKNIAFISQKFPYICFVDLTWEKGNKIFIKTPIFIKYFSVNKYYYSFSDKFLWTYWYEMYPISTFPSIIESNENSFTISDKHKIYLNNYLKSTKEKRVILLKKGIKENINNNFIYKSYIDENSSYEYIEPIETIEKNTSSVYNTIYEHIIVDQIKGKKFLTLLFFGNESASTFKEKLTNEFIKEGYQTKLTYRKTKKDLKFSFLEKKLKSFKWLSITFSSKNSGKVFTIINDNKNLNTNKKATKIYKGKEQLLQDDSFCLICPLSYETSKQLAKNFKNSQDITVSLKLKAGTRKFELDRTQLSTFLTMLECFEAN